jgi:hypothetical protein
LAAWRRARRQLRPPPRLPLGLHLALDLSPINLRRRALFDPPHAEVEEALLPGRTVGLGHFRPFPNDLRARSRISQTPKDFTFFSFWINYGSKIFWSRTVRVATVDWAPDYGDLPTL